MSRSVIAGVTLATALFACTDSTTSTPPTADAAVPGIDSSAPQADAGRPDATLPGDAGPTDASATDAPTDTATQAACDLTKPFGSATLVSYPLTLDDYSARLSADQLLVYLMSNRNGYFQIFSLTRANPNAAFANDALLAGVNFTNANTSKATVTADGLTLYEESDTDQDAGQGAAVRLYVSTRATPASAFAAPTLLDLGTTNSDFSPFVSADGNALYFSSDRAGTIDAYTATKQGGGGFGAPVAIAELNVPGQITLNPLPSADGHTIYFTSGRAGSGAKGNNDVWVAQRAATSGPFDAPTNVSELNTDANDEPTWLSPDGCTLWFASSGVPDDAGPSDGRAHIYKATKPQ